MRHLKLEYVMKPGEPTLFNCRITSNLNKRIFDRTRASGKLECAVNVAEGECKFNVSVSVLLPTRYRY